LVFRSVGSIATLKLKGDLAELKVAADLLDRGCSISIPFGEDSDYDLIADFRECCTASRSSSRSPTERRSSSDADRSH
jgi:hypothetical protein